jgi:hypothetical protein
MHNESLAAEIASKRRFSMKKLNFRVAIVGLIAVLIMAGSARKLQADPSPNAAVNGFCSDNDDFGLRHGQCVSIAEAFVNALANRGVADAINTCKILEQVFGPFPLGQCVSRFVSD